MARPVLHVATKLQQYLPCDLRIGWEDGTELFYNLRFSRSRRRRRSYSLPLRPDIVLSAADGRRTALDAKFRLRWLDDFAPDAEEVDDTGASNERRGIFKQADLYKMHTYRDALGVPSVWILYPGDDFRFYEARRDGVDVKLPSGLRHPIDGVGAIPVKPLVEAEELREVIRTLLVADPKPMQPR